MKQQEGIQEIISRIELSKIDGSSHDEIKCHFDIHPKQFLEFAKKDLENQDTRSLVNATGNIKRAIATAITIILVYAVTGKISISLGVGSIDAIIKMVLYYIHERAWISISSGKTEGKT